MQPVKILQQARREKYAIGQFNTSTFEITQAIIQAAKETDATVIIGTSEGERNFWGAENMVALIKSFRENTYNRIILHSDHCKSLKSFKKAVDAGYDSVHIDGSGLEYEKNLNLTEKAANYAKKENPRIMVEGELGQIGGGSKLHPDQEIKITKQNLTLPEQVIPFVQKTKVDILAIAIGTAHGTYKSKPKIDFERLRTINEKSEVPLVLHGGSGTPEDDIQKAIQNGISKININTILRKTYSDSLRQSLQEKPDIITPYKIMPPVIKAVKNKVKAKIKLFSSK